MPPQTRTFSTKISHKEKSHPKGLTVTTCSHEGHSPQTMAFRPATPQEVGAPPLTLGELAVLFLFFPVIEIKSHIRILFNRTGDIK